jgi:alkanesulfonate monooxygenase SsuD/methylene tetrahydromethanopterin reductase-like flavin-dependent oxidoreductase (luciferase family)
MNVGLMLPMFSSNVAAPMNAAREAEALGFDGVFGFDHMFPIGGAPDGPALECFAMLAAAAAITSRIAVGTLVTRVGLRPVGLLSKLAAGLDHVSGGRAILALGTGDRHSDGEHAVYGFPVEPMATRAERLEETVAALRSAFAGEPFAGGRLVPGIDGPLLPVPVRAGGPPIWVGGTSDAVLRIAARSADGWNGWGLTAEAFSKRYGSLTVTRPVGPSRPPGAASSSSGRTRLRLGASPRNAPRGGASPLRSPDRWIGCGTISPRSRPPARRGRSCSPPARRTAAR